MTKKAPPVSIVLATALIAFAIWVFFHFREPRFQGKSLSKWLLESRETEDSCDLMVASEFDSPSARALRAMGPDTLPTLIRRVSTRPFGFRADVEAFASKHPWIRFRPRRYSEIHDETAIAFAVLGPIAKPAVPELLKLLESDAPAVRSLAAFCIARTGADSKEVVSALTRYADRTLRMTSGWQSGYSEMFFATYSLLRLGESARPALPEITALAGRESSPIANAALWKLSGQSLSPLLESLGDTCDSSNKLQSIRILRWMGSNAAPAIPALIGGLQCTNVDILYYALSTLGRTRMDPEQCIPALRTLLLSTNGSVRWSTLDALRRFKGSPIDTQTVAAIITCLQDRELVARKLATNALRSLAPEAVVKAGIEP